MSAAEYFRKSAELLEKIEATQGDAIRDAAQLMASSIAGDNWVYLFGSGHSVIPVLDVYPRYGSYVGYKPIMDPRLMWFNVIGPGGAPELLWLERQEGYIANFLKTYSITDKDSMVVYSHGGLNAAPIEAAQYARAKGCKVIAVTSMDNHRKAEARHSSGMKLADAADVVIDNSVPLEDSLVDVGQIEKVGAGSTLAVIVISMALVAETARVLKERGVHLTTFVSPNVEGVSPDHNLKVFEQYQLKTRRRS
ncbi:MAG: SIS domain-containing protein [Acidobacteriota bacterium]|nr:MAG: SIS domain-containing protein [Acidobacteriota bacterium]